ncbi:hypothetical protein I3842_15G141300 [Carya illinoinensis]|uniref:Uncharacterized protein n=1 Tax=Carya illinoinensis TaxID=32201 RepID=A0A922DBR2_CARIL|nr:hypothetical protein I3842_15G141300 [Carya illinoinensis]KAG6676226.1 hypothetical protein I3842_15G141300 [Carya illinoinensis]
MNKLNPRDALKLFSWHAFKRDQPDNDFVELTKLALQYAGGLPLALIVVGSNLRGRDTRFWESELKKYKRIPNKKIYDILKISFDGLDDVEKNIFLDIACFFKGDKREYVTKILDSCGFFAYAGIINLIDKSLITVNEFDRLWMHDLLEDMGKEIVRQESPEEPGKRSRLWFHEDVREVLEKNKGTEQIEGILINIPWRDRMIRLGSEVFAKMERLRILIMLSCSVSFCGGLNYLSNELRVLDWYKCPLEFWPSTFHGEKLIVLKMRGSMIRDLGMGLLSKNLTSIDLSYCEYLTKISDLSSCSNLEELIVDECKSLVEVHDSVGFLDKLSQLRFKQCSSLKNLPRSFKLRSLKVLKLEGCTSLEYFPEIECEMEHLKHLWLESIVIQELPSSITYFTGLKKLGLYRCESLVRFPINIFQLESLREVNIFNSPNLVNFGKEVGQNGQSMPCTQENEISSSMELLTLSPPESNFNLRELILSGSGIVSLPPCIEGFVGLCQLDLRDCKQLEEILQLPPNIEVVDAAGCISLVEVHDSVGFLDKLVELSFEGCSSLKRFLPESNNLFRAYNFSSSLHKLNLSRSCIVSLPPCIERFVGLISLDLSNCEQLEEIPQLPQNIEDVYAGGCKSLVEVHDSVGFLDKLVKLSFEGCSNLKNLPRNFKLKSLELLELQGCTSLEYFPEIECEMEHLKGLWLESTVIRKLPSSFTYLIGLELLELRMCESLMCLPKNIFQLKHLGKVDVSYCPNLVNFGEEVGQNGQSMPFTQENEFSSSTELIQLPPPESNNFFGTSNFSYSLWTLILSGSGIVSLPPCIKGFVGLSHLYLEDCKQLEEILHLPPNIEEVDARRCGLLERFPHVSTESSFGIPDLKRLSKIDLSECNKVDVDVGNHAPDPLLVQECFREKESSTIIYPGSRIPEWFKYCKETTSYTNSIEIEIDHNASIYGHQIVALVLCSVVGRLDEREFIAISINGKLIRHRNYLRPSMDTHCVCLQYIAGNSMMLSRRYKVGNNMRFTFGIRSKKAILKSAGVHLIYRNDNFIDPI